MASPENTAPGPNDRARYIFLENAQAKDRAIRIIGSVVPARFVTEPFDYFRPNWDADYEPSERRALERVMDDIWRLANPPVKVQDVIARKRIATSMDTNLKFTSLVQGAATSALNEEVSIESGEVNFYSFLDPGANIPDKLVTCKPWKAQIEKLIHNDTAKQGFYIVTGVAVVKDIEVSWLRENARDRSIEAKLPGEVLNAASHGVTLLSGKLAEALDIGAKWLKSRQNDSQVFARCSGEIILAVKFNELNYVMADAPDTVPDVPTTNAPAKKQGFFKSIFSFKSKPSDAATSGSSASGGRVTSASNGHVVVPSGPGQKASKRPVLEIETADLGDPVRGWGLSGALGIGDDDHDKDQNQDQDNATQEDVDVFWIKEGRYIKDGERVYPDGQKVPLA